MNVPKILRRAVAVFPLAAIATLAQAIDYTPQVGTWLINEEFNGKPGRGFQIDVQNDVLVLYFYGYHQSGESTYWLAAGKLNPGSNELTADLGAYEGGMAFGDPIGNAVYLGSAGTMTIRFNGVNRGEICLPEESCKAISAFNFGFPDSAQELLGAWLVTTTDSGSDDADGLVVVFDEVVASADPAVVDVARGSTVVDVDSGGSSGVDVTVEADVACEKRANPAPWQYHCTVTAPGEVIPFRINTARNVFVGAVFNSQGTEAEDNLTGFRVRTATGRVVLPN